MLKIDYSAILDSDPSEWPLDDLPLPKGETYYSAINRSGAEASWIHTRVLPSLNIYGPWTSAHEELWRNLGHPRMRYFAAPDEDLSFLIGLNDKLRSLDLLNTTTNEWPVTECTNLRELVLNYNAKGALDLSKLVNLRVFSSEWRNHFGFENLAKLEIVATGGPGHPADLNYLRELPSLKALDVAQARRLVDLREIERFENLETISLYGLPKVTTLPDFSRFSKLKRLEVINLKHTSVDVESLIGLNEFELLRAFNVKVLNLEKFQTRPNVGIGIDATNKDLALGGKYHWLADRFVGMHDD